MKGFFCLILSALLLMTTGCSSGSNGATQDQRQSAHLLSITAKMVEVVDAEKKFYFMEALEHCTDEIDKGDIILVSADSAEISSILESYQDNNNFRIYFPKVDDAEDNMCVTCFDIIQYDSTGKVVQQYE